MKNKVTKFRSISILLVFTPLLLVMAACSGEAETPQESTAAQSATATLIPTVETESNSATEAETDVTTVTSPEGENATNSETETAQAPDVAPPTTAKSQPFTATTGLDTFESYRMTFSLTMDGTLQGESTTGTVKGTVESTTDPEAQHWQIEMVGDAFKELAMLGAVEIYSIDDTIYIQNPLDDTWMGVPSFLVEGLLPAEMVDPQDSIELPATAIPQPGEEVVNGVVSQKYVFGPEDISSDGSNYDEVEGSIWVAVDGNYVVRYEAVIAGQHNDLAAGGLELLEEGTITMTYDVSDINSDFTLEAPEEVENIDLGRF